MDKAHLICRLSLLVTRSTAPPALSNNLFYRKVPESLSPAPSVKSYDAGPLVHPDHEEELCRTACPDLVWLAAVAKGQREGTLAGEDDRTCRRGDRRRVVRHGGATSCWTLSPRTNTTRSSENHFCGRYGGNFSAQSSGCIRFGVYRDIKLENILLTANPSHPFPRGQTSCEADRLRASCAKSTVTTNGYARAAAPSPPELLVAAHSTANAETPLPSFSPTPSNAHSTTHFARALERNSRAHAHPVVRWTRNGPSGARCHSFALVTGALHFDPPLMLNSTRRLPTSTPNMRVDDGYFV
ncbi:hypothetical protein V8E53_000848 [Lactarius tabidus]